MPDMEALDKAMADEDTVARVMTANRVDRVVSWCGWRSPELGGAALGLILANTVFPPALLLTFVSLGWIPTERLLRTRRERQERRQLTQRPAAGHGVDKADDDTEVA